MGKMDGFKAENNGFHVNFMGILLGTSSWTWGFKWDPFIYCMKNGIRIGRMPLVNMVRWTIPGKWMFIPGKILHE